MQFFAMMLGDVQASQTPRAHCNGLGSSNTRAAA
jgi:hypothetical protein